jgi:hypothetical protein
VKVDEKVMKLKAYEEENQNSRIRDADIRV